MCNLINDFLTSFVISLTIYLKSFEFNIVDFIRFRLLQSSHVKMRYLIVLAIVCCVNAQIDLEKLQEFNNTDPEACKIREGASDDDVQTLLESFDVESISREGKCFLECFLEQIGIVR